MRLAFVGFWVASCGVFDYAMAQLPPKIPNMTPNWPDFSLHHQKFSFMGSHQSPPVLNPPAAPPAASHQNNNPSWVDEFLDFSAARRGSHRRSASDSVAYLEAPLLEHCRNSSAPGSGANSGHNQHEFDRFDDEQFMSMFTDEISPSAVAVPPTGSSSNPSSPSDHNSINEEKQADQKQRQQQQQQQPKNEPEEVQSPCQSDSQDNSPPNSNPGNPADRIVDPKRVKRILANRQSAQRSRVRKLQYISELERSVNSLQAEVSVLSPRVAFLDHQRLLLNVDNSALKQRIAALAQDKIFKDAHQEALKREIERLRQVYHQQSLHKMENNNGNNNINSNSNNASAASPPPPPPSSEPNNPPPLENSKEQLLSA